MNIVELLDKQANQRGDQVAINHRDSSISFAQLCLQSRRGANYLRNLGLGKGDIALVFVPMSIDLYTILLALWREGITAMFLDPSAGSGRIKDCCERVKPKCFIGIPKAHLLRITTPAIRHIPIKLSTGFSITCKKWSKRRAFLTEHHLVSIEEDSPALITFTSGTTGRPKGTVRSHGFLLDQKKVLDEALKLKEGEVNLATLPIFALINLASGVSTIIPSADLKKPGLVSAEETLLDIARFKPDTAVGSPAFFLRLLNHSMSKELRCFKSIFTGGAPVFPAYLEKLHKSMPLTNHISVYGSTEAEPIAELNYSEISEQDMRAMANGEGLLAGTIIDRINCTIIKDSWGSSLSEMSEYEFLTITQPKMEAGEIVVNGIHVLKGYIGGIGDSENKFKVDGEVWHRTGDLGYIDQQGRLWLLGRCSAKIDDEKGILFPFAVETAVMNNPAIIRAALCGINGKRILIIESQQNSAVVRKQLDETMRKFQIDQLIFQEIPLDKRHNAKVDYPELLKNLKRTRQLDDN